MCYSIKSMKENVSRPEYNKNRLMLLEADKIKIFALFIWSPDWWPVSHWMDIFAYLQESIQKYKLKRARCQMQSTRHVKRLLQTLFIAESNGKIVQNSNKCSENDPVWCVALLASASKNVQQCKPRWLALKQYWVWMVKIFQSAAP